MRMTRHAPAIALFQRITLYAVTEHVTPMKTVTVVLMTVEPVLHHHLYAVTEHVTPMKTATAVRMTAEPVLLYAVTDNAMAMKPVATAQPTAEPVIEAIRARLAWPFLPSPLQCSAGENRIVRHPATRSAIFLARQKTGTGTGDNRGNGEADSPLAPCPPVQKGTCHTLPSGRRWACE